MRKTFQCQRSCLDLTGLNAHHHTDQARLYISRQYVPQVARRKETERTSAKRLVTVVDVEVYLVADARTLRRLNGLGTEEGRDGDQQKAEREPAEDHGGRRGKSVKMSASAATRLCRRGDLITSGVAVDTGP